MAALLAAQTTSVGHHVFIHVLVAHGGLGVVDSQLVKGLVQPKVGHDRGDHGVHHQLAPFLHVLAVDVENVVAGNHIAQFIHAQAAVSIAVKGKAHVQMVIQDKFLQALDMGGAGVGVDVISVGLCIDHIGLGAQGVKDGFCNVPGGAVGAVQTNPHPLEGVQTQGNQVADVAVPACHMVHGPSNLIPLGQGQFLPGPAEGFQVAVQVGFHQGNHALIHFLTKAVDQFDAVVVVRVVAGGDHDAALKSLGPGHIGHGRSGSDVQQISVSAGGHQTSYQTVLKHIAAAAGILSDDHSCRTVLAAAAAQLGVVPAQETANFIGVVGGQSAVGFSPEAVGSKILSHRKRLLSTVVFQRPEGTLSAWGR